MSIDFSSSWWLKLKSTIHEASTWGDAYSVDAERSTVRRERELRRTMDAETRRIHLQMVDALSATSLRDVQQPADVGSLLSAAARVYSENRLPWDLALQLLGRLDADSVRAVFSTPNGGWSLLMDVCRMVPQEDELVQALLEAGAGATINASNGEGATALMVASRHDFTSAARLLVERHAHIDQLDAYGRSALHHACETVATGPLVLLVGVDATIHPRALRCCMTSAARVVGAYVLCLLFVCLVVVWLSQHLHCLHPFCPWLLAPPTKKARRRRRVSHGGTSSQQPTPSARPLLVNRLYRRPELQAICLICAGAAIIVRALLYQQQMVNRALETHVQHLPTIHWELFSLAQVGAMLAAAAVFPDLNNGATSQQRLSQLVVTRASVVLLTAYIVGTAHFGISARRMLAFGSSSASADPAQMTSMAIGVATGSIPLKLSTWIRMCCVLHTTVFELVMLPVFLTGMQLTQGSSPKAWHAGSLRGPCSAPSASPTD